MLTPLKFNKQFLGIDLNIEFDYYTAIFQLWQFIYEINLKNSIQTRHSNYDFITYALKKLPNRSYIIFNFEPTNNMFVQFMKNGENIMLKVPVWKGNCYEGKTRQLKQLVKDYKIKKSAVSWTKYDTEGADLDINFHKSTKRATIFTLLIGKYIFKFKKPAIYGYETHRLATKN